MLRKLPTTTTVDLAAELEVRAQRFEELAELEPHSTISAQRRRDAAQIRLVIALALNSAEGEQDGLVNQWLAAADQYLAALAMTSAAIVMEEARIKSDAALSARVAL